MIPCASPSSVRQDPWPYDLALTGSVRKILRINLKTAKQIGLTIPPNVLARADKVIR